MWTDFLKKCVRVSDPLASSGRRTRGPALPRVGGRQGELAPDRPTPAFTWGRGAGVGGSLHPGAAWEGA